MLRYLPFFYGIFIDKSLLFFSLLVEFGLEESTTVHDIFFNISKDTVDSLSIILTCIFLFHISNLLELIVFFKTHIELVCMEGFHYVEVFCISGFLRFDIFDKVFISELWMSYIEPRKVSGWWGLTKWLTLEATSWSNFTVLAKCYPLSILVVEGCANIYNWVNRRIC